MKSIISHIKMKVRNSYRALFPNFYISSLNNELINMDSALDIGCGKDSHLKFVNIPLKVGVDYHQPYIMISQKRGIHHEYILSDVRKLDSRIKKKSFDACVCLQVIEHFEKEEGFKIIKNMETWAKKKLVLSVPNGYFFVSPGPNDNPDERHISGWFASEFRAMGFKVYGFDGPKLLGPLRKGRNSIIKSLLSLVSDLTQFYFYKHPEHAFQLLCIKEL